MNEKILQVFFGVDCLPYKDSARSVHFPVAGNSFTGASNTTQVRFYVKDIGGTATTTWVSVAKRPNGTKLYKILSATLDTTITPNEYYVALDLDSAYTQFNGDLYISLNGYAGGVHLDYDSETHLYTPVGGTIVQATGSVKISIGYTPYMPIGYGDTATHETSVQEALALVSSKLDTASGIVSVNSIDSENVSNYNENQVLYDKGAKVFYKVASGAFVKQNLVSFNTTLSTSGNDITMTLTLSDSLGAISNVSIVLTDYFVSKALSQTISGSKTFTAQTNFQGRAVFSAIANLYNTYLETNSKNYFARVGVTTNQYVTYKLPYNYSDVGSQEYTLITKEYTDTELAKKVDKVSSNYRLYGTSSSGNQITIGYSVNNDSATIPMRNNDGNIGVALTPTLNAHATSKKYVDDNLNLKADKSTTYTKTEVNNLIDSVKSGEVVLVNTTTYPTKEQFLASTGVEGTIYLYPINTSDLSEGYYRYVWETISGTAQWVSLGTTEIDLSDYYTSDQVDTLFESYYTSSQVDTLLGGYVPTSRTISGLALSSNITAQALTDALVLTNTTTDVDYILGE